MKKLLLNPYSGDVWLFRDRKEYERAYHKLTKQDSKIDSDVLGRTTYLNCHGLGRYLVYASRDKNKAQELSILVHELSHVVLDRFKHIGSDPRDSNGEPFCYLLDYLVKECVKK